MKTGRMTRQHVCQDRSHELPSINNRYLGRRNRYAYLPCFPAGFITDMRSVEKWDFEERRMVGKYEFGGIAGEVTFVPRSSSNDDDEDDGFLVVFVYKEDLDASQWVVLDARTMELKASVNLPCRVPLGFHGCWITDTQLKSAEGLPSSARSRL